MLISIIIVNWRSKDYLRACLNSIAAHASDLPLQVVVVDSGSFDGCAEMLAREFPAVVFVQSKENLGFARANNLGARHARGNYLLLLNPDTLLHEGSLHQLLRAAERLPDHGILGAHLLNTDGTAQTSCVQAFPTVIGELLNAEALRRRFPKARLWGMAALFAEPKQIAQVEVISGACMLVRTSCFERVGGFSEDYFMYVEDVDLCRKMTRAGLRNYYVPDAVVTHHGGGSSRQISCFAAVMRSEALKRYFLIWHGPWVAASFRISLGVAAACRLCLLLIGGRKHSRPSTGDGPWARWMSIARWAFSGAPQMGS